jgi:hypothetical protein
MLHLPLITDYEFETILLKDADVSLFENFTCEHDEIERYIKEDALGDNSVGKGVTSLIVDKKANRLVAYYTLASCALLYFKDEEVLGKNNIDEIKISGISSIEIKMFAVSTSYQDVKCDDGKGHEIPISAFILGSLIGEIYNISLYTTGIETIVLHAIPDAVDFYIRNSFVPLDKYYSLHDSYTEGCTPMYMELF